MRHSILFFPDRKKKTPNFGLLRLRVRFNGSVLSFNLGYTINILHWNRKAQRCNKNSLHSGINANKINAKIQKCENEINHLFFTYEEQKRNISVQSLKNDINHILGKKDQETTNTNDFFTVFDDFRSEKNKLAWNINTYNLYKTLRNTLLSYNPNLTFDDITNNFYILFTEFLINQNKKNSTIKKILAETDTFLRWAHKNKILKINVNDIIKIKLLQPKNKVIYLNSNELQKIRNLIDLPPELEIIRDIFLFSCYTALRRSDLFRFEPVNYNNGRINIITQKTNVKLDFILNDKAQNIANKYLKLNETCIFSRYKNIYHANNIKHLCKLAEISTPTKKVEYIGKERIETIKPKHEYIGTHTGRRTFICNALLQGMPLHAVMKITGHLSIKTMQKYIDIMNEELDNYMGKLNF